MYLSREKKTLFFIFTGVLATLVIVGVIIIPSINRIIQLDGDTYNLRTYMEKRYQHAVDLQTALKNLEKIQPQVATFDNHLYHQEDELKLVTSLENIATKNAVAQKISNSNFDKPTNSLLSLTILVTGSYPDVLNYIHDLETQDYFFTIRHLNMSGEQDPVSKETTVSVSIDVSLYVAP